MAFAVWWCHFQISGWRHHSFRMRKTSDCRIKAKRKVTSTSDDVISILVQGPIHRWCHDFSFPTVSMAVSSLVLEALWFKQSGPESLTQLVRTSDLSITFDNWRWYQNGISESWLLLVLAQIEPHRTTCRVASNLCKTNGTGKIHQNDIG